jgi:hypothetical protein
MKDPITDMLLKNSNLTRIQFETLIIDMLIDLMSDKNITFDQKVLFRRENVSRGSFSRSLQQARRNIIESILTIVLLSYIGVFDERPFDDYVFLAERLKEYVEIIHSTENHEKNSVIRRIERELLEGISGLIKPTNIQIM